jgi:protein ImuB
MSAALILPVPLMPASVAAPLVEPFVAPVIVPAVVPAPPITTPPQSRRSRKQTWLALHFSDWSMHAVLRTLSHEQRAVLTQKPVAIVDQDRQRRVLTANHVALARGVRVGHTLNAALALCSQLQLLPRDIAAEHKLLLELAAWAQRYTPLVSMESPNELLLEVRGSLRLFGGSALLLKDIQQALQQQQLIASMALSPTARASLCLARGQHSTREPSVVTPMQLKTALSSLPLSCLHWPVEIEIRLARFGITRLGELWRLPRADLARRIGVRYLRELNALLGRQVELRHSFNPVPVYRDRILLDFEISSTQLLEQVFSVALNRLQQYLREHDFSLGRVLIELKHRELAATHLCIGLATPTAEMKRAAALLHEQLQRLVLPAPVLEIKLHVKKLLAAQGIAQDFLASIACHRPAQSQTDMLGSLLERLQVRLGANAVRSLQLHADHRPECAQKKLDAELQLKGSNARLPMQPLRPLWLLPEPVVLGESMRPPQQLQLLHGPERIEAGWWNDAPVKRDYYVARDGNQACWVFKDLLNSSGWYRQGWFG